MIPTIIYNVIAFILLPSGTTEMRPVFASKTKRGAQALIRTEGRGLKADYKHSGLKIERYVIDSTRLYT